MSREAAFVPGTLAYYAVFWDEYVLQDHSEHDRLLRFVRDGLSLPDFEDPAAEGMFEGKICRGADLTPAKFANHVEPELESSVDSEKAVFFVKAGHREVGKCNGCSCSARAVDAGDDRPRGERSLSRAVGTVVVEVFRFRLAGRVLCVNRVVPRLVCILVCVPLIELRRGAILADFRLSDDQID